MENQLLFKEQQPQVAKHEVGPDKMDKKMIAEDNKTKETAQFNKLAQNKRSSLPLEFWFFLRHNKKWWLLPILIILLVLGILVFLGGTALAPFIYPLF